MAKLIFFLYALTFQCNLKGMLKIKLDSITFSQGM